MNVRIMNREAELRQGDVFRLITLKEAKRLYGTIDDDITFPEAAGYTLHIPKSVLRDYGGMRARISGIKSICGHFHYLIMIEESGEVLKVPFCPSAFVVCEEDDTGEAAELAPPDPESMWYFLGVTESVSLRNKL